MTEESAESDKQETISTGNYKDADEPSAKKVRLFSAKEFRKQLNSDERLSALIKFSELVTGDYKHQYVKEYLESGGSCLELLQIVETDNSISPALVFKIVYHILLSVNTNFLQYQPAAQEACRYLMSTFVPLLNKMLGLNSSVIERKTVLQLLTAVVTSSATLAKDVLLQINFNPTNMELLTKLVNVEDSVRNAFVNFLTAFLVDGQYPTLAVLLEKRGLLTSIIRGLQYDNADSVCMVITALKIHVLENPYVSKTVKMKVFSTPVVKDIVNLYNWKGPKAIVDNKKDKEIRQIEVDEYKKSKVSQCVHDFLLVLCTSHKFGVIFRDRSLGLGKKHHNSLMYTVLESLDQPWVHSYAGELVTKICKACPDLTRTLWSNLKPSLEPRSTSTWLTAMKFAKQLLNEMDPSCIEYCAKDLKTHQLAQTIQFLVAPTPILKSVIPEFAKSKPIIKYSILQFLNSMLKLIELYLTASKTWLTVDNQLLLKRLLSEHINRNFPDAHDILRNWDKNKIDDDLLQYTVLDYLNVCFDLLESYKHLCPSLLEALATRLDLQSFSEKILKVSEQHKNAYVLFVKAVSLIMCISPTSLFPNNDIFQFVLVKLFESYYSNVDCMSKNVLYEVFKNTSIFEGCESEIDLWIDGVLNQKTSDVNLYEFIVLSVKETFKNYNKYLDEISELSSKDSEDAESTSKLHDYLENILDDDSEMPSTAIKNTSLSSLIFGVLIVSKNIEQNKSIKMYTSFVLYSLLHLQSNAEVLLAVINNANSDLIPNHFLEYANSWKNHDVPVRPITKFKGRLSFIQSFSEALLNGDMTVFLKENSGTLQLLTNHYQNFLQMCIFYFTNSVKRADVTDKLLNNCEAFVSYLAQNSLTENNLKAILGHPVLLQNFSPLHVDKHDVRDLCTQMVLHSAKLILQSAVCDQSELYLKAYRSKTLKAVLKVLKKSTKQWSPSRFDKFIAIIETLQLDRKQCICVLSAVADVIETDIPNPDDISYNILNYAFGQFQMLSKNKRVFKPLEPKVIELLSVYLKHLNTLQCNSSAFVRLLKSYLEMFPHSVDEVDLGLFESILTKNEYCKDNTSLAVYLLKSSNKNCEVYSKAIKSKIDIVCGKKGLVLPLLDVVVSKKIPVVELVYINFKESILKSLQKPQKAGQHFERHYIPVAHLLNKYFSDEECKNYVQKVQKFDISEPFHVYLLTTIFQKYLLKNKNCTEPQVSNSVLTLIHLSLQLFKKKTKSDADWQKLEEITDTFCEYIEKISENATTRNFAYKLLLENESFSLYCKFCLKFGVSGKSILLKILSSLSTLIKLDENTATVLLEMSISHSEVLDVVLGDESECKLELLKLFLVLVEQWPGILKSNHVPMLLAAYQATLSAADRCILMLLKICEKNSEETHFDNFKPVLFGRAAAGHYSVRSDIQSALWRQPKIGDVLNILQDHFVTNTIKHHSLSLDLQTLDTEIDSDKALARTTYDLTFLLPLFDQLLAPENAVQTYRFTKSGAVALTIVALGSYSEDVRKAACHVLSRFYYHLEARQTGKDNLLWLRFIKAVCKGTAVLENYMLNSFAAIFLSRMALVLTQPGHVMYVPVSQYLGAKSTLDFSGIPELYTFLHSSDVNYKDHRSFILEVIRDGLRTERDFEVALRSMAFKLIMELFDCGVSDLETKRLILEVFKKSCHMFSAVQMLCTSYGFLSWLYCVTRNISEETVNALLPLVIDIVLVIGRTVQYEKSLDISIIGLILLHVVHEFLKFISDESVVISLLKSIDLLLDCTPNFFNHQSLENIIMHVDSKYCEYLLKHHCKYSTYSDENVLEKDVNYYVKQLTIKWITVSEKQ